VPASEGGTSTTGSHPRGTSPRRPHPGASQQV